MCVGEGGGLRAAQVAQEACITPPSHSGPDNHLHYYYYHYHHHHHHHHNSQQHHVREGGGGVKTDKDI